MSRHKFVKALDPDEVLNDLDEGYGDDYEEQNVLSAEDKELLREGTVKVRNALGTDFLINDKEIEESLWHYYYDVRRTVNYLRTKNAEAVPKGAIKKTETPKTTLAADTEAYRVGSNMSVHPSIGKETGLARLSASDSFRDCPWLNVPKERRGEILIEPLYLRGGLLGGSLQHGNGKPSKLAALAAARRRKENHKPLERTSNSSVALSDGLEWTRLSSTASNKPSGQKEDAPKRQATSLSSHTSVVRKYPTRRRASTEDDEPDSGRHRLDSPKPILNDTQGTPKPLAIIAASPSAFAQTIFGLPSATSRGFDHSSVEKESSRQPHITNYALPLTPMTITESFAFAGPSPDDVVMKAQNFKGGKSIETDNTKSVSGVTQALQKSTLTEAPKVKSRNLNVLAEFEKTKHKPAANFVVIGHVDAGKSTLMGRLLYDLEVVDQRTLEKYRKEAESIAKSSFALAWVLDQGTDERSQGVTIDIGMHRFETDKTDFTILDAPGHRDFIPNMIAGASQADFAVLVIDASTGSYESGLRGQTKEHALLVRCMGVQRIIVAVNKLDTLSWSEDRFLEIQQQVSAFLTAAGFQPKNLAFLPCSGLTGDNVVRRVVNPKAFWYDGPPLIALLEPSEPFTRALKKPLRLTIDDIFRGGVQNPLSISCRIDAGNIQIGDVVAVVPSNETASIKGIEVDSEPRDWAVAGQNATLHLANIEQKYLKIGDMICPPSAPVKPLHNFTMKILAFEHVLPMAVEVHRGRLHAPGRISKLVAVLDKSTGAPVERGKKKVKIVRPGNVARVLVEVDDAVPLEMGARVVLRAGGETVGAGLLE